MSALDAAREAVVPSLRGDPRQAVVAAKCLGLLAGYHARWGAEDQYRIDSVESVLLGDLYNPETQRKSRSFTLAGKLDVRATDNATGAKLLIDHKTASQEIADPGAPYWQQLAVEGQVSHYMLLEWLNANRVDYGVWDVIRKPGISPKGLTKAEVGVSLETASYCGTTLPADELAELAEMKRETPAMYAARLAQDCTAERPGWYFQRRRVPRLDGELREYAQELWGHAQDLLATRHSGRHPRNSGACFTYNSPCKFLGVCSGHDSIDEPHWIAKERVHAELPALPGRGGNVLTNSRIRCFQTCRQKHYFQYELGVERLDEEEREVLFFGNLMHGALEAYFLALQDQQRKLTTVLL